MLAVEASQELLDLLAPHQGVAVIHVAKVERTAGELVECPRFDRLHKEDDRDAGDRASHWEARDLLVNSALVVEKGEAEDGFQELYDVFRQ